MLTAMSLIGSARRSLGAALFTLTCWSAAPTSSAWAQGVPFNQATEAQKKDAQTHYERGAKLFEQKKLEEALAAFSASYGVVKSPNAHLMMTRALIDMNELLRAHAELKLVEAEAAAPGNERYAATGEKARSLRLEIQKKLALVRVTVRGDATGKSARIGTQELAINEERAFLPASVRVELLEAGVVKAVSEVQLLAGEQRMIELTPPPPPAPPPPPPPPPQQPPVYETTVDHKALTISGAVVGLVGVAGVGIGTSLFFLAKGDHDDLGELCGPSGNACPTGSADTIDAGKSKLMGAQIAMVTGGVLAAGGLGLLVGGLVGGANKKKSDDISVGLGPGSLSLSGRF